MSKKLPLINAAGISYKSAAARVAPAPTNAAMIVAAPNKALSQIALSKGGRPEEFSSDLATEWTGVVARGCVGDTLGVFRVVDVVGEELAGFATLPAHLATSGVTNIIVTINITKN